MINKFEGIGIFICVGIMAVALFLMRFDTNTSLLSSIESNTQAASVIEAGDNNISASLADAMNERGVVMNLLVDDVILGEGDTADKGDTVSVHYIGTLQSGEQFDNSYIKGEPFSFKLGSGEVIRGWDEGLVGMKEGGQRIIVVPAEMAYGNNAVGPIPANSTLVFAVELIEVK